MLEPSYCPRCHHPLAENAPAGLCPNCLLQFALEPSTAALDPSGNRYRPASTEYSIPTTLPFDTQPFGDYELLELIGRGGMGVIYRARQLSLNRIVALKMMRPGLVASEAEAGRFRVEAEAIASLQHPNIVAIHEVGECEDQLYFSMDYVEGQSLAASIREHPLSAENAARQVITIAEAIHYAHEKGILHRDLKPSNILLDQTGQPRVTDFGLAKRLAGGSGLTATGDVLGTPSYMPPEQASGKIDQLGPASDVYSLGAILYELLTGRPPFQAATPLDTVLLALKTEPITPRRLVRGLNRDLETICLKCLEKEPRRRYQSAQDLADDLGRFLRREPVKARRINPINRSLRWCRRNPWPTVAAAALVLLATIASIAAINSRNRLWRSLVDQVRLERLAGNREKSMRSIAEAARIKQSAELQEEAIQTIIAPDLRLLHQIPVGNIYDMIFSPDSKMLAISGSFVVKGANGKEDRSDKVATWEMPSGRPIVSAHNGWAAIAFNPRSTLLASSHCDRVSLFDSAAGTETALPDLPFCGAFLSLPPIFSPDGGYLVKTMGRLRSDDVDPYGNFTVKGNGRIPEKDKADNLIWIFNARNQNEREIRTDVSIVHFLSNKDLLVASASALERYDLETRQSRKLASSEMEVLSISANGKVAALRSLQPNRSKNITSASYILWDTVLDKQIGVFSAAAGADSQILLSADGRFVALYDPDQPNMLRLWERAGWEFKQRLIALGATSKIYLNRSDFNADGSLLAAFGTDGGRGNVWIWDTQTGGEVARLRDHHSPIWSENGRLLATRGPGAVSIHYENKTVEHFDDQTARPGSSPVKINVESKTVVSTTWPAGLDDGIKMDNTMAFVWEVTAPLATYQIANQINSLSFSTDGNRLAANNVMWDVAKIGDRTLLRPTSQKLPGRYAVFEGAGRLWSADLKNEKDRPYEFTVPQGGMWQSIKLWLIAPEEIEIVLKNQGYSGLNFGSVRRYYMDNQGNHHDVEQDSHKATDIQPYALAISPDFRSLALASWVKWEAPDHASGTGGVIELWDLATQKRLKILNNDPSSGNTTDIRISSVRFNPDGTYLAVGQTGSAGFFIDIATGKKHGPYPDLFEGVFSPNSRNYYSSISIGDLRVHDVETGAQTDFPIGQHQGEASARAISARAISADGNWFASGGKEKKICLWNLRRNRQSACWTAHQTGVTALAFSPDGQTLVSGGVDGRLILWNLKFIARELSALGLGID